MDSGGGKNGQKSFSPKSKVHSIEILGLTKDNAGFFADYFF